MFDAKPEPRPELILRLLNEARKGKLCNVSMVDSLEFRRDQYGLSKREFATLLGMGYSHYVEFLNGKRNLPLNARIRAHAIGVPAEVLLQQDTEMRRRNLSALSKGAQEGVV